MRTLLRIAAISLLFPLLVFAAADPAALCDAAKFAAAGKYAAAAIACHAKAAKEGEPVDPECTAKAVSKLEAAFAKAEAKGECATSGDVSAAAGHVDSAVTEMVTLLRPTSAPSKCIAAKLSASGKYAASVLQLYSKDSKKPDAGKLIASYDAADEKFATAFAKAEARCATKTSRTVSAALSGAAAQVGTSVSNLATDTTKSNYCCRQDPDIRCGGGGSSSFRCAHAGGTCAPIENAHPYRSNPPGPPPTACCIPGLSCKDEGVGSCHDSFCGGDGIGTCTSSPKSNGADCSSGVCEDGSCVPRACLWWCLPTGDQDSCVNACALANADGSCTSNPCGGQGISAPRGAQRRGVAFCEENCAGLSCSNCGL